MKTTNKGSQLNKSNRDVVFSKGNGKSWFIKVNLSALTKNNPPMKKLLNSICYLINQFGFVKRNKNSNNKKYAANR